MTGLTVDEKKAVISKYNRDHYLKSKEKRRVRNALYLEANHEALKAKARHRYATDEVFRTSQVLKSRRVRLQKLEAKTQLLPLEVPE
jgi:hypothetical protein